MNKMRKILPALQCGGKPPRRFPVSFACPLENISVAFCGLANLRAVERVDVVNVGRPGRPFARWRSRLASTETDRSSTVLG
jgi:hypothetical protein